MNTSFTSDDEMAQDRIERMTHRFPDLRPGTVQHALTTGDSLGRVLQALIKRIRRGRPDVVTVYIESVRK